MPSAKRLHIPDRSAPMLGTLSNIPFGSAQDYANIEGLRVDSVREYLAELRDLGYAACRHYGTPELRSERRWWVTTSGYRALEAKYDYDEARAMYRRDLAGLGVMKRRADVAAVVTRVIARLAPFALGSFPKSPPHFVLQYFRAGPLDCLVGIDAEWYLGIVYAGSSLRLRSVRKRLEALKSLPLASKYHVLVLATGLFDRDVVLDYLRTLRLRGAVAVAGAAVGGSQSCWLSTESNGWVSHETIASRYFTSLVFERSGRSVIDEDLELPFLRERTTPVRHIAEVASLNLPPLTKKFMAILVHWPMLSRGAALNVLGVSRPQFSDLLRQLRGLDLVATQDIAGDLHYALTDRGISYASARDRCDSTAMLDRLSIQRLWDGAASSQQNDKSRRRGSLIRTFLKNYRHDCIAMGFMGKLIAGLKNTGWTVTDTLPPRRARIVLKPGDDIYELQSALTSWRVLPTDSPDVREHRNAFFPDGVFYLHRGGDVVRVLLEVEFGATTVGAWQSRLETYVLRSVTEPSGDLPLFVIGSASSEALALAAQTAWVQTARSRAWPVATTTVDLLQTESVTAPIWRVHSRSERRVHLFSLPQFTQLR